MAGKLAKRVVVPQALLLRLQHLILNMARVGRKEEVAVHPLGGGLVVQAPVIMETAVMR
jgi:hypothetical protein